MARRRPPRSKKLVSKLGQPEHTDKQFGEKRFVWPHVELIVGEGGTLSVKAR